MKKQFRQERVILKYANTLTFIHVLSSCESLSLHETEMFSISAFGLTAVVALCSQMQHIAYIVNRVVMSSLLVPEQNKLLQSVSEPNWPSTNFNRNGFSYKRWLLLHYNFFQSVISI